MKKRKILLNAFLTLPLISPYFKLIFDIVYRADYSSILLDACLAGPCLVLVVIMWARAIKFNAWYVSVMNEISNNNKSNKDVTVK